MNFRCLLYIVEKINHMVWEQILLIITDSKVHGANMGPIWGRQDPGGPHVGPMNFAIWDLIYWVIVQLLSIYVIALMEFSMKLNHWCNVS